MKKMITLLALSFFTTTAFTQKLANSFNMKPVKSVDWGTLSVRFVDGFWEMAETELKKKFTQKMVDSLVRYSMSMYNSPGFEYAKKEELKMYLVAEFNNNFGGQFRGVKYIVMIPYAENKHLWVQGRSTPNDFFLLFSKEGVTIQ